MLKWTKCSGYQLCIWGWHAGVPDHFKAKVRHSCRQAKSSKLTERKTKLPLGK